MTEAEHVAARYVSALAAIVAVLGPDHICSCEFPADCGLPYEADEALKIATDALAGRSEMDEQITPGVMELRKAEHAELQRRFGVNVNRGDMETWAKEQVIAAMSQEGKDERCGLGPRKHSRSPPTRSLVVGPEPFDLRDYPMRQAPSC